MDEHSEGPNSSNEDANYYGDNMNGGIGQFAGRSFADKNTGLNDYGDKEEQYTVKGLPSQTTGANDYGDNMKGDHFEKFIGKNLNKTKEIKTEDLIKLEDLEEYRSYPNEAKVNELPLKRNNEKYPSLRTMKDAISADSSIIDDELKALDAEDLKIGEIFLIWILSGRVIAFLIHGEIKEGVFRPNDLNT